MLRILAAAALATSVLWAGGFWEKKPYTEWSQKEVAKLLTNSPWASRYVILLGPGRVGPGSEARVPGGFGGGPGGYGGGVPGGPAGGPRGTAGAAADGPAGGGAGGGYGPGGPGGAPGGFGGGGGYGAPGGPQMSLIVRWHSALPIKQALVKSRFGEDADSPAAGIQEFLAPETEHYIVALSGLPVRMAAAVRANPEPFKQHAFLNRKGKPPIPVEDVQVVGDQEWAEIRMLFPRSEPITLADKQVQVIAKLGPIDVKKTFKLKAMVFQGQPAL